MSSSAAMARDGVPEKPSVEVNLGALRQLQELIPAEYQPAKPQPTYKAEVPLVPAPKPAPAPVPVIVAPSPVVMPAPLPPKLQPLPAPPVVVAPIVAPIPVAIAPRPKEPEPVARPVPEAPTPVIMPAPLPTPRTVPIENHKIDPRPVEHKPAEEPFVPAPLPAIVVPVAKPAPMLPPPPMPAPKIEVQPAPSEGLKPGASIAIPLIGASGASTVPPVAVYVPDAPLKSLEKQAGESVPGVPVRAAKPQAKPEPKLTPQTLPTLIAPLPETALPEKSAKAAVEKTAKELAKETKVIKPAVVAPVISTAPMMIPVPPTSPELPASVKDRLQKTFGAEPKQQGVISDIKTIKNSPEQKAKAEAEAEAPLPKLIEAPKLPEPVKKEVKLPEAPLPKLIEAPKLPEPVKKEVKLPEAPLPKLIEAPKLPEPVKKEVKLPEAPLPKLIEAPKLPEPVKKEVKLPEAPLPKLIEAPKLPEPVKKEAPVALPQPSVLPMPMPPLGASKEVVKPAVSLALPDKAPEVKIALPEKLPPAELPPISEVPSTAVPIAAAEKKPITLPKTEIAVLPKINGKDVPAMKSPELPKPPAAQIPAEKKVLAMPDLPLPEPKAVDVPKLPELPVMKPVEVVKVPEPAKVVQPVKKDVAPSTLPKLPLENELKVPAKPALPSLDAIIGDTKRSSADILQPKDSIESKPLGSATAAPVVPALPKFPMDAVSPKAVSALPPLPLPEAKPAEVKIAAAVKPEPVPAKPLEPSALPALPLPEPKAVDVPAPAMNIKPVLSAGETLSRSVSYEKGKSDLSNAEKGNLDAVAEKVKQSKGTVRVVAYASGTAEETSVAKRTSLARALQIRAHLISKGVDGQSISTQAMGNKVDGNADRADVFVK